MITIQVTGAPYSGADKALDLIAEGLRREFVIVKVDKDYGVISATLPPEQKT